MKICFLSRYQNTQIRGAEVFVGELTRFLGKGHQVEILSGKEADSINRIIRGGYDVVIPINGRGQSLLVSLGRLIGGYKVLITGHSGVGKDDLWNIVIGKPDIFVALTNYMESWARKWAWGSKVVKIPNGVDLEKFSPNGTNSKILLEKPIILSVGALTWYKRHDLSIEAVSKLSKGSLLIVGDGEEKDNLQRLGQAKLGNRFKIMKVSHQDIPNIYRSVDLFLLPSWEREAFGLVYLEAMASNLPVVAPDNPPRREIIGKAGIFCNVENSDDYSKAIEEALAKDFKNIPREQASKFGWEIIAKMYEEALLGLFKK